VNSQRIRVTYTKGARLRFTSHLDVLRAWERALRRAGLPLAYSEGFTPHPRLAFASPLPLGFTGDAEIVDVTLHTRLPVAEFTARLQAQSTEALAVVNAIEVPLGDPPPQAAMLWADYRVDLPEVKPADAAAAIASFLSQNHCPWTEDRHEKRRTYDLRATVAALHAQSRPDGGTRVHMRLRSDQEFSGRPEQVVIALLGECATCGYARTGLILAERSPAREAWRRKGRFE